MGHDALIAEIEDWLIGEALVDPDILGLFSDMCDRLHAAGIPVDRAALMWPTLHPLFQAEMVFWRLGHGGELEQFPHSDTIGPAFEGSPFAHVLRHHLDHLRRALTGPGKMLDFPVLHDLAEQGFADYLLTSTRFRVARVVSERLHHGRATGILASWATRREGGFTDADLEALTRVQRVFAVTCHASIQSRVMFNLADAFLGPTAAQRVLSGEVRLGDGEFIRALVWFSDLRGSTSLSDSMAPGDYLDLLRRYYGCTAQPVLDAGGEILEFIGDAVLAIFPIEGEDGLARAVRAATGAIEAALGNRDAEIAADPPPGEIPRFSISLAVGDVMFGNIGVPSRISFSVIGRIVNALSRVDKATKTVGRSVLVTPEVAAIEPEKWVSVGPVPLDDFATPQELFAPAHGRDVFDAAATRTADRRTA